MSAPLSHASPDVDDLRASGVQRGASVTFMLDREPLVAFAGESVAAALWAAGRRELRRSPRADLPRGMFCMMGSCQECLVWIGARKLASCQVPVSEGLAVETLPHREHLCG
jgi:predicted molibdopterin-dependent oxidoreductase YjgC